LIILVTLTILSGCEEEEIVEYPVLSVDEPVVSEGNQGKTQVLVTMYRTGDISKSSTVNYSTRSGTAIEDIDFEQSSGVIEFAVNETQAELSITILADKTNELDEFLYLDLSEGDNIELVVASLEILIINDDPVPVVSFAQETQKTSEENSSLTVNLVLSNPTEETVVVQYTITGTASRDTDYTLHTNTEIEFVPTTSLASIDLSVLSDIIPEGGESIIFSLLSAENAQVGGIIQHTVVISGDTTINDTGFSTFTDEVLFNLLSEPSSHPGQDAYYGRDATALTDYDGHSGFSYTKLDYNGNELSSAAENWHCVRDNVTGLVWEVKQETNTFYPETEDEEGETIEEYYEYTNNYRAENMRYYWFNDESSSSGGSIGHQNFRLDEKNPIQILCGYRPSEDQFGNKVLNRDHGLYCNTQSYIEEVQFYALCGYKDWRLPLVEELRGLADYHVDRADTGMIDVRYFPNGAADEYFSSNPSPEKDGSTYCFDSSNGRVELCNKGTARRVRLVRSGK